MKPEELDRLRELYDGRNRFDGTYNAFVTAIETAFHSLADELETLRAANVRLQELHTGLMKNADNMNDELRAANAKVRQDAIEECAKVAENTVVFDYEGEEIYGDTAGCKIRNLACEAVPVQQHQSNPIDGA